MIGKTSHGRIRALLFRRPLLPLILVMTGVLMVGCRRPAALDPPSPTLPAPSAATDEPTESDAPAPTATDVSTPVPTARVPATEAPEATDEPTPSASQTSAPAVGARAPDLTLPDLNGDEVSLSSLEGNVVLLNFWTTW